MQLEVRPILVVCVYDVGGRLERDSTRPTARVGAGQTPAEEGNSASVVCWVREEEQVRLYYYYEMLRKQPDWYDFEYA